MDQGVVVTFPAYTFMLADGSGAMFLRAGDELYVPLFTSWTAVETYLKRSTIDGANVIRLADADALVGYLENPPAGVAKYSAEKVVVDPVAPDATVRLVLDRRALIADLKSRS